MLAHKGPGPQQQALSLVGDTRAKTLGNVHPGGSVPLVTQTNPLGPTWSDWNVDAIGQPVPTITVTLTSVPKPRYPSS